MIKGIFIVATACLIFTSCDVRKKDARSNILNGAEQPVAAKDPTTVQIIDSAYDFGNINEGDQVEYNYKFKNTGNKPLVIIHTSASCGCTVPEKPEQPILPGEVGFIKVKFNSEHRAGNAHKTINVESNANPAFPTLTLTGVVKAKDNK
ncbi:MAG: DUF1573 domain-containing protein [Bacteroidetes bacterium]|nr:DUF1573 domain-containing protein [Bacteroidota bacterium]MBS1756780.1 DUF1573 domain-containing protein [Bacteroidota bacterium]